MLTTNTYFELSGMMGSSLAMTPEGSTVRRDTGRGRLCYAAMQWNREDQEMAKNLAPETVAAQAAGAIDEETGGIVPPLHLTTTFLRDPDNQYRKGYIYGRADNATVRQVEAVLTQLEGGAASLILAS